MVPVAHTWEELGALSVAMPPSDPMDPTKDALVRDLAAQAGLVMRNGRGPQVVEAALYFSVLEALQNVVKYADASRVAIRLTHGSHAVTFVVTDDGRGFDPTSTGYGTGLQGMLDRLGALDGSLEIASAPGAGTTVTGTVPF